MWMDDKIQSIIYYLGNYDDSFWQFKFFLEFFVIVIAAKFPIRRVSWTALILIIS